MSDLETSCTCNLLYDIGDRIRCVGVLVQSNGAGSGWVGPVCCVWECPKHRERESRVWECPVHKLLEWSREWRVESGEYQRHSVTAYVVTLLVTPHLLCFGHSQTQLLSLSLCFGRSQTQHTLLLCIGHSQTHLPPFTFKDRIISAFFRMSDK
jgi:hypothetical protein